MKLKYNKLKVSCETNKKGERRWNFIHTIIYKVNYNKII